jgi:hypothetical protein
MRQVKDGGRWHLLVAKFDDVCGEDLADSLLCRH